MNARIISLFFISIYQNNTNFEFFSAKSASLMCVIEDIIKEMSINTEAKIFIT